MRLDESGEAVAAAPGMRVRLGGLSSAAAAPLNGRTGVLGGHPKAERWTVHLEQQVRP